MKRAIFASTALLVLAFFSSPVRAEPRSWIFDVNPGWAFPLGAAGQTQTSAFMVQASGERPLTPHISAGLELGWLRSNFQGTLSGATFISNANATVVQATPFVRVTADAATLGVQWHPYALVGAGFYDGWTGSGTIAVNGGTQGAINATSSVSHFGVNGGVGAVVEVDRRSFAGIELAYHRIFTRSDFDGDHGGNDAIQLLVPSLRFGYRFGGAD